tara:strand:+ start:5556 stop:6941 length:1386 start_codon:yes stop_codon:yes gene_type:complete
MGFNAKAFATAFLNSQADSINQRLDDARKYKEEQEDLARNNIGLYKKRKQQMMMRIQQANAMQQMGASKAQIMAYANSGPGALQGAYRALMVAQTANGGNKLHPDVVTQIMGSAEEFAGVEGSYEDFIRKTSGLYGDLMNSETEDKTDPAVQQGNWFMASMGFGAKDRARRSLREKQIFEGMSVQALNDLARTEDIQQILPGATANLQVIPQSLTASERQRIFDNFDDYAQGALETMWNSMPVEEKEALSRKYNVEPSTMQGMLLTIGSKVFEAEKQNVVDAYLEGIGDPFTESLVLRSRFGYDDEEQVEGPKLPPTEDPNVPAGDPRNEINSQKELALNYPDAEEFTINVPVGESPRSQLENLIRENNLEAGDVIVLNGSYVVIDEDYVESATNAKDNLKNLDRILYNLITRNEKSKLMDKLDDYRLKEYLKENPSQISELMKDPKTWLTMNASIFEEKE